MSTTKKEAVARAICCPDGECRGKSYGWPCFSKDHINQATAVLKAVDAWEAEQAEEHATKRDGGSNRPEPASPTLPTVETQEEIDAWMTAPAAEGP
jgi:hypothetical protein